MQSEGPVIAMKNISKRFGGVQALRNVDFEIFRNEVIGLVGDNGAGKSTMAKVLCGVHEADEGDIYVEGRRTIIKNPEDARRAGIEIIYQDLALVEDFTVVENVFLGKELTSLRVKPMRVLDNRKMHKEAGKLLERLKIDIPYLKQKVFYLSGGQRQAVAIARAIHFKYTTNVLILDEPTAAMGVKQKKKIFDLVVRLKESQGLSQVVITHNMEDIFAITDRIVVLRNGGVVGIRKKEETDKQEIVSLIVG